MWKAVQWMFLCPPVVYRFQTNCVTGLNNWSYLLNGRRTHRDWTIKTSLILVELHHPVRSHDCGCIPLSVHQKRHATSCYVNFYVDALPANTNLLPARKMWWNDQWCGRFAQFNMISVNMSADLRRYQTYCKMSLHIWTSDHFGLELDSFSAWAWSWGEMGQTQRQSKWEAFRGTGFWPAISLAF